MLSYFPKIRSAGVCLDLGVPPSQHNAPARFGSGLSCHPGGSHGIWLMSEWTGMNRWSSNHRKNMFKMLLHYDSYIYKLIVFKVRICCYCVVIPWGLLSLYIYMLLLILHLKLNYIDAYCNVICNIISHLCMAHNRSEQHSREPATYSPGMHPAWYWGYKLDYGLVWKWMSILWHDSRGSNSDLAMDPWEGSHELQKCQKWQDYWHEWGLLDSQLGNLGQYDKIPPL